MEKILNVLLVDDDEDDYILLKEMFARLPGQGNGVRFHLDWVATYEQALEACTRQEYDIQLVDYHLGRYNGLDLIRAGLERGCLAPSILLTGQGSYELDLAAMEQGVYDYLLKSQLNEGLLEHAIRYALERRDSEAELERRVRERTRELAEANEQLGETNQELKAAITRREEVEVMLRAREARLRESEARFRSLAEATSAAIFIVQDGQIRYANPAVRFVTGYEPAELLGTELWQLAHPVYQTSLREGRLANRWADNVPARYEIKIITKQGEERWMDITAGDMEFEGRPAHVYTAFDITERDLAEQALRKARDELEDRVAMRTAELSARTAEIQAASQRLRTVVRTLPVGLIIADDHARIIESNAAFQQLWDASGPLPTEMEQWQPFQAWWSDTGERLDVHDWPLVRAVEKGEAVIAVLIDIETLTERRKTILISSVPIFAPDGSVSGGVAVAQDITEQRNLEQQAQAAAREAQQRADELEGLHRATAALLSTLDLDELLCQILDAAQSAIPAAERGMLHLVSPTTGQLQVRAMLGFNDERICVIRSPKAAGLPALVARERRPLLVRDVQAELNGKEVWGELQGEMSDIRSIIFAPLYYGEQVLGTLSLSATRPDAFTESNLRLLASFAATTTAALQNAILHAEIKQLAVTDPLTGQYNRRAFFDLGQRELERFLRFNHPLSALMIDLDNFKQVNDTFGHNAGDQILRTLAERCRGSIRETDIFGRFGGDEFALLLPDTDLFTAQHIAGRIRDAVASEPWITEQGLVPVSVSLGVAQANKRHHVLEDLLADADQALYKAKSSGRNRVEVL